MKSGIIIFVIVCICIKESFGSRKEMRSLGGKQGWEGDFII